jgi:hypothetical protein
LQLGRKTGYPAQRVPVLQVKLADIVKLGVVGAGVAGVDRGSSPLTSTA